MDILKLIIQFILVGIFLMAASGKIKGSEMHKKSFESWGMPQSFRVITGIVELVAALLLIAGFWNHTALYMGAALLVAVGMGGVLTHIKAKDSLKDTAMILILGIMAAILLVLVW